MDPFGLVTDVANLGLSLYNNQKNREFAERQATTAFNRQVQMFNMQNAYNAPAAQMQRFVDAGLNPNLVYGQMQNGLSAPTVPQGSAQNQNDPQLLLNNALAAKQIERLDTENNIDKQRVEQDIKESLSRIGVNDQNAQYLAGLTSTVPISIAQMEQNISLMSYNQRSLGYDIALKSLTQSDIVGQYSADLKKSKLELQYLGGYFTAQIFGLKSAAKRDLAAAHLSKEQAEVAKAVANLYGIQADYDTENLNRFRQYNREYYDNKYSIGNGLKFTPLQYDMFGSAARSQYQTKLTGLLQKYGDTKEVMGIIQIGTQILQNTSDAVSNFTPHRSINTSLRRNY